MGIRIMASPGVLPMFFRKFQGFGAGMQIYSLPAACGDKILHHVHQILLQRLQPCHRQIKGAFLRNDAAGRMMGINNDYAVSDAGSCRNNPGLSGHIMECADPVVGLYRKSFPIYHVNLLPTAGTGGANR